VPCSRLPRPRPTPTVDILAPAQACRTKINCLIPTVPAGCYFKGEPQARGKFEAGPLGRGDVYEDVGRAVVALDEGEAPLVIDPGNRALEADA
jgi:hypothetical protein